MTNKKNTTRTFVKSSKTIGYITALVAVAGTLGASTLYANETNSIGSGLRSHLHDHMIDHAELLGLSSEALAARIEAGESLRDIATAQGLTHEDLEVARERAQQEKIESLLADGTITQEQADERLSRIEDHKLRHEEREATVAEFFDLSAEELQEFREAGMFFEEIAEQQGLSADDISAFWDEFRPNNKHNCAKEHNASQ